eukprot:TRINITY_DN24590_c0_g1_i3.p1 TRINITY_DN24590_c0_g1~~TRINITY_DN24590_c0_g1_i3.p1  ORF type:complete len:220 (-),score=67.18 TRINITY_DN24590_c0_g1_i3:41-700(-)
MSRMLRVRVCWHEGELVIRVPDTMKVVQFQSELSKATSIPAARQHVMVGFPPHTWGNGARPNPRDMVGEYVQDGDLVMVERSDRGALAAAYGLREQEDEICLGEPIPYHSDEEDAAHKKQQAKEDRRRLESALMTAHPSFPSPCGVERAASGEASGDWDVIDDDELAEAMQWEHDQALLKQSRELSLIHISEPTRLLSISYAVFCLKKKKIKTHTNNST